MQTLFARYTEQGVSLFSLAQSLEREGIRSPSGLPRWNPSTLRQVLKNPIYMGQLYANRIRAVAVRKRSSALGPVSPVSPWGPPTTKPGLRTTVPWLATSSCA